MDDTKTKNVREDRSSGISRDELIARNSRPSPEYLSNLRAEVPGAEPLSVDRYTSEEMAP